jgi:hypothetical protein
MQTKNMAKNTGMRTLSMETAENDNEWTETDSGSNLRWEGECSELGRGVLESSDNDARGHC